MRNTKYGQVFTKEEKRRDAIKGLVKLLKIGDYAREAEKERFIIREYGMTEDEIWKEINELYDTCFN